MTPSRNSTFRVRNLDGFGGIVTLNGALDPPRAGDRITVIDHNDAEQHEIVRVVERVSNDPRGFHWRIVCEPKVHRDEAGYDYCSRGGAVCPPHGPCDCRDDAR